MSTRRKLILIGAVAVLVIFVLLTLAQNWGKATAQRDIRRAESAAAACIANPGGGAQQCEFAAREIGAALPEIERSGKQELILRTQKTLAQVHMATGKHMEAAGLYVKVAAAHPQQSAPYRDVAEAYSLAGRHRAAERYARLSVQLQPDDWRAHAHHGRILARAGKSAEAVVALEEALAQAPAEQRRAIEHMLRQVEARLPAAVAGENG